MRSGELFGRRSRRQFAHETLAAAVAAAAGRDAVGGAVAVDAGVLAEYARAADPATRVEPVADGEFAGGRFRTLRLVSQRWRGAEWTHELSLFLPSDAAAAADTMLLWIDGGSAHRVRELGPQASDAVRTLAVAANATGLPAAVVRQIPYQPMFGGLVEDDLIAHTFVEFARTGDASWPLLLPMVKAAVEAMTAATAVAHDAWGVDIGRFVVTGASERGWTSWLTAAVDERVKGLMPMVIDMLSMERHLDLQRASFGGLSTELEPYIAVGVENLIASPRGRELCGIVDPYAYRERIVQPKIIALGTNDPYWPLEALGLYLDGLSGPRWVSYAPNAGHGLPLPRVAGLVSALGRHVAGIRPLPTLEWAIATDPRGGACTVQSDEEPDELVLWATEAETRDFRQARWRATPLPVGERRALIPRPARGFAAGFVEARYPREPLPLLLTTSVHVERAS